MEIELLRLSQKRTVIGGGGVGTNRSRTRYGKNENWIVSSVDMSDRGEDGDEVNVGEGVYVEDEVNVGEGVYVEDDVYVGEGVWIGVDVWVSVITII
jgi:UDP-3-O-[3-hydroxymyristoyl] glucosamine N-acyltransferase